jgi:hypothetical protein
MSETRLVRQIHLCCMGCGHEWDAPIKHMCLNCLDPDALVVPAGVTIEIVPLQEEQVPPKLPPVVEVCVPVTAQREFNPSPSRSARPRPCSPLSSQELSDLHLQYPWW